MYRSVKSKLQHPPPPPPPPRHLTPLPSRGGEFELHPRFHVKSLAWRAIIGDGALEDFRGKDCSFMANWLRGKGLNKLCAVFEGIWILMFLILDTGFEYMNVLSCVYNEIEYLYWQFNATIKSSTEARENDRGQLLWPATCVLINKVRDNACQWNGHDVVISVGGIFFIQRFVCCMTHEENLLLNYFSFELMITWMDPSVGIWTTFWPG